MLTCIILIAISFFLSILYYILVRTYYRIKGGEVIKFPLWFYIIHYLIILLPIINIILIVGLYFWTFMPDYESEIGFLEEIQPEFVHRRYANNILSRCWIKVKNFLTLRI